MSAPAAGHQAPCAFPLRLDIDPSAEFLPTYRIRLNSSMRSADPVDERLHDSFIPKCENDGAPSRFGSSFMLFSGHHSLRFGPRWQAARAALADAMAALFFGRERRRSREALKNFATSIGWMAVNWCMAPVIYIAMKSTQQLYGTLSIPALPASTWETVPWPILLLISVLLKDFADYWNHRLMHMRWIWPIHAVHHSDTHVNFLTSYRIHFLESVFMDASYVILLTWLGVPPIIGAIGGRLFTLHNVYVHIDIDFGHGPFKYILASPRLHRWHHADHPDALGKNLAILFPFYDLLFGTYYLPGRCDKPMGALSENVPPFNLAAQVALPFTRWLQMGSASAKHLAGWAFATARPRPKA